MLASRLHWRLLIGTVLVLMAAAWLAPRFVRAPDIQENRVLAAKPAWPERLQDLAGYRKAADAYVADHFPLRRHLIGALNRVRMLAGVSGSNRVIIGRDGWLYYDDDTHLGAARGDPPMSEVDVRQWLMTLAGRTEALKARGVTYLVLAPPVKETLYPQHAPAWFPGPSPGRVAMVLPKLAQASGAGDVLYLHPWVAAATKAGDKTYSRHDTHWDGFGAYAGYVALMGHLHALGLTEAPWPRDRFVRSDKQGGLGPRDLALMLGVSSFVHLEFPHLVNPAGEHPETISYLGEKHDWTAPQVVDTGETGKPVLLMTRDSFSNELMPFLLPHFSRIVLAHNQDGFWRQDLIDRFKPDIVIVEVIEPGLRVAMGSNGPPPSPAAVARIDHTLGSAVVASLSGAKAPLMPSLSRPDARTLAALDGAPSAEACNLEIASLTPGLAGEGVLRVSGWIVEPGNRVTSPDGMARLQVPGVDLVAPIRVDVSRPDVSKALQRPSAEHSAYVGTFFVAKMPPGPYRPTVYRRTRDGWLACPGKQPLVAP
jgi:hypothetical protein